MIGIRLTGFRMSTYKSNAYSLKIDCKLSKTCENELIAVN